METARSRSLLPSGRRVIPDAPVGVVGMTVEESVHSGGGNVIEKYTAVGTAPSHRASRGRSAQSRVAPGAEYRGPPRSLR